MDEPEVEPNPPTATEVARRAAILKFQFVRVATTPPQGILDDLAASWSQSDKDAFIATLEQNRLEFVAALRERGLWEDLTLDEREIFAASAGELTMRHRVNASWRAESIGCLAWAMRLLDALPAYDTQTDPEHVVSLVPIDAPSFIAASLRPMAELERAREIAELWHWRSRTRGLREEGRHPYEELDAIVRQVAPRAANDGMIGPVISDDFPAFGKAYRDLTGEEWSGAQSIAMERHLAFNWLCGLAPDPMNGTRHPLIHRHHRRGLPNEALHLSKELWWLAALAFYMFLCK